MKVDKRRYNAANLRLFTFICGSNSPIFLAGDCKLILTGYSQVCPKEAYISFIAVHPEYRRIKIASSLATVLMQKLSVDGIPHINITTWSTNPEVCIMYKQVGYRIFRMLKDDRGPGIDTIYLKKAIE